MPMVQPGAELVSQSVEKLRSGDKTAIEAVLQAATGSSGAAIAASKAIDTIVGSFTAPSEKGLRSSPSELAAMVAITQSVTKYEPLQGRVAEQIRTQTTEALRALDGAAADDTEFQREARTLVKPLIAITAGKDSRFLTALSAGIQAAHLASPALKDNRNNFLATVLAKEAKEGTVAS